MEIKLNKKLQLIPTVNVNIIKAKVCVNVNFA